MSDQENDASADRGSIPICYHVQSGTWLDSTHSSRRQCPTHNGTKKFNTKVDVGSAISITQQHKVLLKYVAQENHTLAFTALSDEQKQSVHKNDEECYISYAFLHQSRAQHGNLKVDLRNDFTTGSNQYPKTHQQTLHLLDMYSKTVVVPKMTSSEGSSFTQHQGANFWNQNDSFLNQNDRASKRPFFNMRSKISHKFANLVLICELQSNQRRPNLTWDLGFAFIDQIVLVNN